MIDVSHLSRAEILRRLYNASCPLGMGFLHFDTEEMTVEEAEELLKKQDYFDYIKGRVMKVRIPQDGQLNVRLYDRDCGPGAAARALGIEPKMKALKTSEAPGEAFGRELLDAWKGYKRVPALALKGLAFSACSSRCALIEHCGCCECEGVCPEKFDADGKPKSQEELDRQ